MTHIWQALRSGDWLTTARARDDSPIPFAIWVTIGLISFIVACFGLLGPFEIEWRSFVLPASVSALFASVGWFYLSIRKERRLGAILTSTAQIIAFGAVAAPLSYIAAIPDFPLQDALLQAWDRHLGIDWQQMIAFLSLHPGLQRILSLAYSSFAPQTVTTLLALGVTGRIDRLHVFVSAFIGATLVTIAVSAVLPATGPWLFLDIQPATAHGFLPISATSWPVFFGLRDGTLHAVHGLNSEGIITFPSLHAALGILFATALWRVRGLRWIGLGVNGLMLVATPAYGSHYFVDVIAGVLLAAACWIAASRLIHAAPEAEPRHLATISGSPSIVPGVPPQQTAFSRTFESV